MEGLDITHVDDDVGWVWGVASFPGLCSICCLQYKILCGFCAANNRHCKGLGEFCGVTNAVKVWEQSKVGSVSIEEGNGTACRYKATQKS